MIKVLLNTKNKISKTLQGYKLILNNGYIVYSSDINYIQLLLLSEA